MEVEIAEVADDDRHIMDVEIDEDDTCYDIKSLLSTPDRDFLIRNNGDQVKIDDLSGRTIGILFSLYFDRTHEQSFSNLVETYNEISPKGKFEIIYITDDIHDYFSNMPWLAIPNLNSGTHFHLRRLFKFSDIVILDADGKVLSQGEDATKLVEEYGVEGYPFTPQRIKEIKEQEAAARKEQFWRSFMVSHSLDFLISNDGKKVPVSELDGKMIGLYISFLKKPFFDFTPRLIEAYRTLKERGEHFEIVFITLERENGEDNCFKNTFEQVFGSMPWYALPFQDRRCNKLARYFDLDPPDYSYYDDYSIRAPILIIIGIDGMILSYNATEVIEEHGVEAYPFTIEKLEKLKEVEKAKQKAQTLESILTLGDQDFVIGKDGAKIPITDLVGKTILLFFLDRWYPEYNSVLPELTECYDDIKENNGAFEAILVPYIMHENKYHSAWPWLALPSGDERIIPLIRTFKFYGRHAMFVVLGPTGCTLTKEAWEFIKIYGAEAYPFTDKQLRDTEARFVQMVKGWPEKVKCPFNENHDLVLTLTGFYECYECKRITKQNWCRPFGRGWSYNCEECNCIYHPKCALKEESKDDAVEVKEEADAKEHSLTSILATCSCDFLISNEKQVPISMLEGKMVGLYFYSPRGYQEDIINPEVVSLSKNLKKKGVNFEVVFVYLNQNKYDFKQKIEGTPWYVVPYKGKFREKLFDYFNIQDRQIVLIIFSPDGKIINSDAIEVIREYGYSAYPFTPERSAELEEIVKARLEALTLESLLISWEKDFVIDKEGTKIPVTDLIGKNILLYLTYLEEDYILPLLIKAYREIKAKDNDFEVIFIYDCTCQSIFDQNYSQMPWLALPCGDRRINIFRNTFGFDTPLIAFAPMGHIITRKVRELIIFYGADAYPFTDEHLIEVEAQIDDMAMDWPEKVKHLLHKNHDLLLQHSRRYWCKECNKEGVTWTYRCEGCNSKYHPNCALGVDVGGEKFVLPDVGLYPGYNEEWTCN